MLYYKFNMLSLTSLVFAAFPLVSHGELIGGIDFPEGAVSFADEVVSYEPEIVNGQPIEIYTDPNDALGVPDFNVEDPSCSAGQCAYVSLGREGSITLRFTDNLLTGSDDSTIDLWVFEIGAHIEATGVEISPDGMEWFDVGSTAGAVSGIDIDASGFTSADRFAYVRLTDDLSVDIPGPSRGADIDAVGAISTVPIGLDHFTCYKIKRADKYSYFEEREVILRDQFGDQRFIVVGPQSLCVPSSKELVE